jgi:TRAP-type C4-dicarboxylate transport system substrate-binding protein
MFADGSIDAAEFNAGPLSNAAPGLKAFNLPFLFTDSAHMFRHLDGALGDRLSAKLKDAGFVVLGWYDGGARSFFCANKPMARVEDFAGQRIRVQQSEVYIDMVRLLGATPVVVPFKDILDQLTARKIDCAEGNLVSYESMGQYKVAKYLYLNNHIVSPEALVVSTRLWNRLDDGEKAAFKRAGMDSALLMRRLWNQRVAAARSIVAAGGVQFIPVTDAAALVHRVTPLYAKYMADPEVRSELLSIVGQ